MRRHASAWLAAVLLAGCAGGPRPQAAGTAAMFRDPALGPAQALAALRPGQSTRAEVAARLGAAQVLVFDSGYEVWAYRAPPSGAQPGRRDELVLLFGPDGVLRKQRLLQAAAPSAR